MKYRKLIILLAIIAVLFIGGGLLYRTLSESMNNAAHIDTGTRDVTVPSSIDITAAAETTQTGTADTSSAAASTPPGDNTFSSSADTRTEETSSAAEGITVGSLAYDFTLKDYDGNDVSLSDYRGKIVILNFWASWCGPCREEMPDFQKIQDNITADGEGADTVILAVNMTDGQYETKDTASKYMKDQGYTYPLVFDDGSVSTLYKIYYIPETFILNKDGIIMKVIEGSTDLDTLNAAVEEAKG